MKKDFSFIFQCFKDLFQYSEKETIIFLQKLIIENLQRKKIIKKVLIKLFNTLNEYCKNIVNIKITKNTFVYDITSIILRFNKINVY